ncbi:MAG: Ig domain-containing protein [Muribaculaceae bacterium]
MRLFNLILFSLIVLATQATVIYPGQTTDISYEPTTGEYGPTWTTNNPTISISSVGFLCHLTAQAYFGGTATVTCTYKDRIGSTVYTRTRNWTFTCADTKISISPSSKSLKINESFQISCNYNSTTYITPSVQFSGYDNSIVSVSNSGYVTAKSTGSTKIYVKSNLGTNTAICSVTVYPDGNSTSSTSYYDDWDSQGTKIISLNEPGTLSDLITDSEKYSITNLTIRGPLNGSDLRLIRDMCGRDENGTVTNGKLVVLDLKDAIFVSGGAWYFKWGENEYYYTSDSPEIPFKAFHMMKNIKRIRLPKYCTKIANQSLLFCESLEALSMPPGVEELDNDWLFGGYNDMVLSSISLPSSIKIINLSFASSTC